MIQMIDEAFINLKSLSKLDYKFIEDLTEEEASYGAERVVDITFQDIKHRFYIESRKEVKSANALIAMLFRKYRITQEKNELQEKLLVVANYFTPDVKKALSEKKIAYLEVAGNCCIQRQHLYIQIDGQKNQEIRVSSKDKAFQFTGMKVVLALLLKPELANVSYRKLAKIANVSNGSVGPIIRDLVDQGYLLLKKDDTKELVRKDEIYGRWAELYPISFKNKMLLGRYKCDDDSGCNLQDDGTWLVSSVDTKVNSIEEIPAGGFTLYTRLNTEDIPAAYGLIPDKDGDIEVMRPFWDKVIDIYRKNKYVVNPYLNFADIHCHPKERDVGIYLRTELTNELEK